MNSNVNCVSYSHSSHKVDLVNPMQQGHKLDGQINIAIERTKFLTEKIKSIFYCCKIIWKNY